MPIITEALKIYWGQRTECEDNDDKLFSKNTKLQMYPRGTDLER